MVDPNCSKPIIYDTAQSKWCNINHPELLETNNGLLPVASSGGLLCFRSFSGEFFISNPVSGSHRKLPHVDIEDTVHAIAMSSSSLSSYKLILVHGDPSSLTVKTFDSTLDHWTVSMLHRKTKFQQLALPESGDEYGDETLYYLSKAGDVVATDMQRSPSKQFSSVVITEKNGNEVLYFLSQSGRVVGCNLSEGFWYEYPKILPPFFEHSLDLVECRGEMLVVVMSELLESASLRVWRFSEEKGLWVQVGAIPPSMSHEFYGKKADINCVGHGNLIMVCVSSVSCGFNCEVLCNLEENSWVELPECFISGKPKEFVSAFSFEPRLEACV
ncbi:hypothetical protein AMTR_s00129p00084140 [Amborella trichopoda]|uniref:KIB1-4 beta-propeller domain-containing protein n=2 Tax=Amborella trichopoda TaxID=13333 RepID=W1NKJ8_AMBTC|nr:hypothetical protein AMTR_s00129p00084140 [Amborella trichopoda]